MIYISSNISDFIAFYFERSFERMLYKFAVQGEYYSSVLDPFWMNSVGHSTGGKRNETKRVGAREEFFPNVPYLLEPKRCQQYS